MHADPQKELNEHVAAENVTAPAMQQRAGSWRLSEIPSRPHEGPCSTKYTRVVPLRTSCPLRLYQRESHDYASKPDQLDRGRDASPCPVSLCSYSCTISRSSQLTPVAEGARHCDAAWKNQWPGSHQHSFRFERHPIRALHGAREIDASWNYPPVRLACATCC